MEPLGRAPEARLWRAGGGRVLGRARGACLEGAPGREAAASGLSVWGGPAAAGGGGTREAPERGRSPQPRDPEAACRRRPADPDAVLPMAPAAAGPEMARRALGGPPHPRPHPTPAPGPCSRSRAGRAGGAGALEPGRPGGRGCPTCGCETSLAARPRAPETPGRWRWRGRRVLLSVWL